MKKRVHVVTALWFVAVMALVMWAISLQARVEKAEASVTPTSPMKVYLLKGYNVHSYVYEQDRPVMDGVEWDWIALVNPQVTGERAYIPAEQCHGEEGHFFFIDTLARFTGPVYRIKDDATPFLEDEHGGSVKKEDGYKPRDNGYLFSPEIHPNGMCRVYVDGFCDPVPEGSSKRFFYRQDLELVCAGEDKAQ